MPPIDQNLTTKQNEMREWARQHTQMMSGIGGEVPSRGVFSARGNISPLAKDQDDTGAIATLSESFNQSGTGAEFLRDLLNNFKGTWEDLKEFMEVGAPMANKLDAQTQANRIMGSEGYKHLEDKSNWDLGAIGAYGTQAGQIGRQTRDDMMAAQQGAGAAGLGRSSMRNALSQAIRQQGVTNQSNAFAAAQQRAAQNRMLSAGNLLDAHRTIAQIALGQQITPRMMTGYDEQGPSQGAAGMAGMMSGIGAGAALGPAGMIGGGILGLGAGLLS